MSITNQNNLLNLKEINTRPDLWKDKIYYLERNPYWNKSYDFIPTPKKYAQILQEFQKEIQQQKDQVKANAESKAKAQERIKAIKQELKEWVETIIATYGLEPSQEELEKIKLLKPALAFFFLHQWQKWSKVLEEFFPQEEETISENENSYEPEPGTVQMPGDFPVPEEKESEPQTKEKTSKEKSMRK